jgi:chromate transporter
VNGAPPPPPSPSLPALFTRFLRFGALAFGGPVAQIAALQRELVERERWVDQARFRRALALYQALPGPEATELCIWFGTTARGRLGGLLAGLGFVLPGLCLMLLACWLLFGLHDWPPWLLAAVLGLQAGATALLWRGTYRLARTTLGRHPLPLTIAIGAGIGAGCGVPFYVALLGGGAVLYCSQLPRRLAGFGGNERGNPPLVIAAALLWLLAGWLLASPAPAVSATAATATVDIAGSNAAIAWSGLRAGMLTFGGAYSVIPFLHTDAVLVHHWLDQRQFLAGLAIGSALPAPMVIVGTWVGYAADGLCGALLLTLGIFAPAFAFPLLLHDWLERLVARRGLHALLDGVAAAVTGLVTATALTVTRPLLTGSGRGLAIAAAVLSLVVAWPHRASVPVAMALAALAGWLLG